MFFKQVKNKKAFTLIEFIIVMAIIGILVLLASPKFLEYVEKAKHTQIINDVKVMENLMTTKIADGIKKEDLFTDNTNKDNLGYKKDTKYTKGLKGETLKSNLKEIKNSYKKEINTKLNGTFYYDVDTNTAFYIDDTIGKDNNNDNEKTIDQKIKEIDTLITNKLKENPDLEIKDPSIKDIIDKLDKIEEDVEKINEPEEKDNYKKQIKDIKDKFNKNINSSPISFNVYTELTADRYQDAQLELIFCDAKDYNNETTLCNIENSKLLNLSDYIEDNRGNKSFKISEITKAHGKGNGQRVYAKMNGNIVHLESDVFDNGGIFKIETVSFDKLNNMVSTKNLSNALELFHIKEITKTQSLDYSTDPVKPDLPISGQQVYAKRNLVPSVKVKNLNDNTYKEIKFEEIIKAYLVSNKIYNKDLLGFNFKNTIKNIDKIDTKTLEILDMKNFNNVNKLEKDLNRIINMSIEDIKSEMISNGLSDQEAQQLSFSINNLKRELRGNIKIQHIEIKEEYDDFMG